VEGDRSSDASASLDTLAFVASSVHHGSIVVFPTFPAESVLKEASMYIARFSYSVLPINRQRAIDFIRREVDSAQRNELNARLLVPLTRGHGGPALQFEIELTSLEQFDQFRERGIESSDETGNWMHAFSEILVSPPEVELLRVEDTAVF
jgi:hypothetical protein